MKTFLAGISPDELKNYLLAKGQPAFRGKQIADWLYKKTCLDPAQMLNLPAGLRQMVAADFFAPSSTIAAIDASGDGVEKLLLTLHDGETIEMVVIPADERVTFCLSTQVGCPVGCRFCASGKNGFTRNLKCGEMLEQFLHGCQRAGKPDNIVFMGIGEGLLNFDELAKTLEILTAPEYFAMSPRRITVSTSGYIPGMERFARLKKEYNLAVSLHAVTDDIRAKLIPPNVRYAINDILDAADRCRDANGRQYTLEYTMISGINDDLASAEKLGAIAKAHHAKVNLIPYNSTGGEFRRPEKSVIEAFQQTVAATGARVTRRVERGGKKTAACGQLRIHHQNSGDDK